MASQAVDRRFNAIQQLVDRQLDGRGRLKPDASRSGALADIDKLRHLGKTDRWQAALIRWDRMVRDNDSPLDWAILQGSVYAGYAAL